MNDPQSPESSPIPEPDPGASTDVPGAEASAEIEEIRKLQDERDQLKDQMLRTMADFQNYRKRMQQETETIRQYASEKLVTMLLPVLDNFERTLASIEQGASMEALVDGVRAIEKQVRHVLDTQHVKRIASVGEPFDPEVHEALGVEPSDEYPDNTVVTQIEAGYRMGDRVIRPARVKVSRKP